MQWGISKALIAVLVAASARVALADDSVGKIGDPSTWEFTGNKAITTDQIRDALVHDPDLQRAMSPKADRFRLLNLIESMLTDAYLASGFVKPQVTAATKVGGAGVKIEIVEGDRYLMGELQISAPEPLDAAKLKEHFLADSPARAYRAQIANYKESVETENAVVWRTLQQPGFSAKGTRIAFDAKSVKGWSWKQTDDFDFQRKWLGLGQSLSELAANEGYFSASVITRLEKTAGKRVNVVLTIDKLGPRAVLDRMECNGLKINTPEKLMAFLKLKPGQPITLKELCNYQMQLHATGRFLKHDLLIAVPEPGKLIMVFDMEEVAGTPPLDEPLSQADQTALKFAQWAEQFRDGDDALTFLSQNEMGGLDMSVHPKGGIILAFNMNKEGKKQQQLRFLVTPNETAFDSDTPAVRYVTPLAFPSAQVEAIFRPRDYRWTAATVYGADAPMSVKWDVFPSAILDLAHRPESVTAFKGPEFSIRTEDKHLVIDAKTGRLITWRSTKEEGGSSLSATRGRFDKIADEMRTSNVPNEYDAKFPFGSALVSALLAGSDRKLSAEEFKSLREILHKTIPFEEIEPAGTAIKNVFVFPEGKFKVPIDFGTYTYLKLLSRSVLADISTAFEYGSWPWTLARVYTFSFFVRDDLMASELTRMYQETEIGPLGCLIAADALATSIPRASAELAELGMTRMNEKAMAADIAAIFPPGRPQTAAFQKLLENLGKLNEKEFEILCRVIPDDWIPAVKALWETVRVTQPDQFISAVSGLLMKPAAKSRLESALRRRLTVH